MVQSRPRVGNRDALFVWLFAFLQHAGFNVVNTVLADESVGDAINAPPSLARSGCFSSRSPGPLSPCVAHGS